MLVRAKLDVGQGEVTCRSGEVSLLCSRCEISGGKNS